MFLLKYVKFNYYTAIKGQNINQAVYLYAVYGILPLKGCDDLKTVGIIAEYNPFHNGHKYHIQQAKALTGADRAIAVMSGSFVQRGEPAVFDKWSRTKAALLNGADAVIELPVFYSTASAELFARASVELLSKTASVDFICFGAETDNLTELKTVAEILLDEPPEFKTVLKSSLASGLTFPAARAKALKSVCSINTDILSTPNNILAVEYLKALKALNSSIKPVAAKRMYTQYNSTETTGCFASATAVRDMIKNQNSNCSYFMPYDFSNISPVFPDDLSGMLNYALRINPPEKLSHIYGINEGLENRIRKASNSSFTFSDIVNSVKTKRYTRTSIQRALLHIILGITYEDIDSISSPFLNHYIRILGFRKISMDIISDIANASSLPLITNANSRRALTETGRLMLKKESAATDIYFLMKNEPNLRKTGLDITTPMVIVP